MILYSTITASDTSSPSWGPSKGCFTTFYSSRASGVIQSLSTDPCPVILGCGCDVMGVVSSCLYPGCSFENVIFDGSDRESISFGEGCKPK